MWRITAGCCVFFFLFTSPVLAQVPPLIPVEGVATDANGVGLEGAHAFSFSLYAEEFGGTVLWAETQNVALVDGFFVTHLGAVEPLDMTIFQANEVVYLGIAVDQEPEMERIQLATAPYAGHAQTCGDATSVGGVLLVDGSSGNVGIGTANPQSKLHVDGSIQVGPLNYVSESGNELHIQANDSAGAMRFFVGGGAAANERLTLANSGNVGIGTPSPAVKLEVVNTTNDINVNNILLAVGREVGTTQTRDSWMLFYGSGGTTDNTWAVGNAGSTHGFTFSYLGDRAMAPNDAGSKLMTIRPNGKVGIGTTEPSERLHIKNDLGGGLKIQSDVQSGIHLAAADGTTGMYIGRSILNDNGNNLFVYDGENGVCRLFVDSSGNVGIGTTSPSARMQVEGPNAPWRGQLMIVDSNADNTADPYITFWNASESGIGNTGLMGHVGFVNPGGKFVVDNWTGGVTHLNAEQGGNVGIGTTNPQSKLQVEGYVQLALTPGAPPSADCDEASERGRMKVDSAAGMLYICVDSGWVAK